MIVVESKANDVARHGDSSGGGGELYLPIAESAMERWPGGVGRTSRDAHDPSIPFGFAQGRRYAATSPASLLRSGHIVISFASPVIRGRWPAGPEGESLSRDTCKFQI